jgi:hypothetical protein
MEWTSTDLVIYKNKMARSVPDIQWDSLPEEGEVIISMVRDMNIVQKSIDPNYLSSWELKAGGDVVVISRNCQLVGCSGTIIDRKDNSQFII